MVVSPRSAAPREQAIAQYLVTKVGWKGSYKRILAVMPASVATYNPETYACTARWELSEIEDIDASRERDQFVLRLEKARFRRAKVRFHCAARAHLLSLLAKLRQHFAIKPAAFRGDAPEAQWKKYRCIEFFGDSSSQSYYLQVGVSAVVLHDDDGREMDSFPYIYLKKAASTHTHPDGIVLGTPYQERLFLCSNRNECLGAIYKAASELGVDLRWHESPLNVQLLRLRNSQLIDQPAIVCFDVLKASDDGSCFVEAQLILQGDVLVEVHPKMRCVVARKYAALLNVVRTEWDVETVGLEFAEGESLVVRLEARDQLIALLLLTCRESGYEHVTISASELQKNRVYHPHVIENAPELAAASMGNFFLKRLLQTGVMDNESALASAGGTRGGGGTSGGGVVLSSALLQRHQSSPESNWLPTRKHNSQRKASEAALGATRDSFDTGESMNDFVSTSIAMEELNANIPLNELSLFCHKDVLNSAVELLAEHLTSLVITLRRFVNAANAEIVTTLQALVRLSYSSHAVLPDILIPRMFDAIHELLTHQDFLTCYWCLKLLQCYFDPVRAEFIYGQRAKILQYVSTQRELLSSLIDLLPSSSSVSSRSSGFWLMGSDGVMEHMSRHSSLDSTLLSKEERLEKDMNAVFYEALFTIHYITIYLHDKHQQQAGDNDVEASANVGDAAQVLREFTTTPAKRRALRATLVDVSPGVPARLKRYVAERLVDKHAFLMDAVVDTRLVRACLSCVALIKFVMLELGRREHDAPASAATKVAAAGNTAPDRNEPSRSSPQDGSSSRRAVRDQSLSTVNRNSNDVETLCVQPRRGARAVPRGARFTSFQDVHDAHDGDDRVRPNVGVEEALQHTIKQLSAFLETYAAKLRAQSNRSHLFQGQHTIIVPLTGFSQSTDEFAGSDKTRSSDYMRLEHLEVAAAESNHHDNGNDNASGGGGRDDNDSANKRSDTVDEQRGRDNKVDGAADNDGENVHKGSELIPGFRATSTDPRRSEDSNNRLNHGSAHSDADRLSSRLFWGSTFFEPAQDSSSSTDVHLRQEQPTTLPRTNQQQQPPQEQQRQRRRMQSAAANTRTSAQRRKPSPATNVHTRVTPRCDACIGCNDVCDNVACFLCSEKKYQLQTTFADSPQPRRHGAIGPSQPAALDDDDDNYVHTERKYSSCELKRHRSLRSCWVVVHGAVCDVTDLLSVHPGGLQVLLQAAQNGEDCGAIIDEHPPSARRVLNNYRLGEYYECEALLA